MFSIIWEYQVKPERRAEFVEIYSSNGSVSIQLGKRIPCAGFGMCRFDRAGKTAGKV